MLTSYSWITLGWRTFFRILISLVILSTSFLSLIFSFSSILTATLNSNYISSKFHTFSPVRMCVACLTYPKVPFPNALPKAHSLWLQGILTYDVMSDCGIWLACTCLRGWCSICRTGCRTIRAISGGCVYSGNQSSCSRWVICTPCLHIIIINNLLLTFNKAWNKSDMCGVLGFWGFGVLRFKNFLILGLWIELMIADSSELEF